MPAICMIPNCRKRAPADEAFCAAHRGHSTMHERSAFEDYCAKRGFFTKAEIVSNRAGDQYFNSKLADMWIGWQLAANYRASHDI
jgi:hypothetical protein